MSPVERWTIARDCAWVELPEGDAAVMPFATNQPMTLSPVGALIWSVIVTGRTSDESLTEPPLPEPSTEQIVAAVSAHVGEAPETVSEGVADFLTQLESAGVLSRSVQG